MKVHVSSTILVALLATNANAFQTAMPTSSFGVVASRKFSSTTELFVEGTKITMPALSSTMKEGRVVSWLKSEGDAISAGEAIMVVESDKADMDVEAFEDGFLARIIVEEGGMAPVGEAVALIAENEADIAAVAAGYSSGGSSASAAAPAAAAPAAAAPAASGEYCLKVICHDYSCACSETL
jgi:pyruvate dehydrogenase E2 component (dihydrolipoamide acetyltransferase)